MTATTPTIPADLWAAYKHLVVRELAEKMYGRYEDADHE